MKSDPVTPLKTICHSPMLNWPFIKNKYENDVWFMFDSNQPVLRRNCQKESWRVALRNCTMLHVVAGSCMFRIIVQVASPFGNDSESKTQVNGQKNTPKLLEFRGIGQFVIPLCFQWLATLCNSLTSCASRWIVASDFTMMTWGYSHSMVAGGFDVMS
mgnify:CR=1 FL=1